MSFGFPFGSYFTTLSCLHSGATFSYVHRFKGLNTFSVYGDDDEEEEELSNDSQLKEPSFKWAGIKLEEKGLMCAVR